MENQQKIRIPLIVLVGIVLVLIISTVAVIKIIQNISMNKNIDLSKNDSLIAVDEDRDDELIETNNLIEEQQIETEKEESIDENAKDESQNTKSIASSNTSSKVSSVTNKNNTTNNSNSNTQKNNNVAKEEKKPDTVIDDKPQEEKNEKTLYDLSSSVSIGDYVDYPVSYSNISISGKKANHTGWRVISKSNGSISLISAGVPESIYLKGISGTVSNVFNSKISKYLNNNYATRVHILTINELKQFVNNINLDKNYSVPTYTSISRSNKYYDLIVTPVGYWLYDMINETGSKFRFYIHHNGIINNMYMGFEDNSSSNSATYGIRPIVTLKYGLKTTGKNNNGVWNITL